MAIRPEEVSSILLRELEGFAPEIEQVGVGTVLEVGDGIARIYGLQDVMASELVEFPSGVVGMILNLEEDNVGAAISSGEFEIYDRRQRVECVSAGRATVVVAIPIAAFFATG